jgi:hypothetical protein
MPPLPAPEIQQNRGLSAFGIDAYPATTGDVTDATAEDAWIRNPTPSVIRAIDRAPSREITGQEEFGIVGEINEPMLTSEEAQARYGIKDHLKFDTDTPDRVAKDLHDLKREELLRQNIMSRAQGGVGETLAQFGTGLGVSILDPLNIASAFIPVVGQARSAAMLARAGEGALARAGARAQIGAVEGLAGAAMLEPIVYGVAKSEQADYDLSDSMLNLAFGTVLGGGLHSGLGRLGDLIRNRGGAEETLRGAIAQVADDRPVMVSNTLRSKLLNTADRDLSAVFDELVPDEIKAGRIAETPEGPKGLAERLSLAERNVSAALSERDGIIVRMDGREQAAVNASAAEETRIAEVAHQDREAVAGLEKDLAEAERSTGFHLNRLEKANDKLKAIIESGAGPTSRERQRATAERDRLEKPFTEAQAKSEALKRQTESRQAVLAGYPDYVSGFRAEQMRSVEGLRGQDARALEAADQKIKDARAAHETIAAERDAVIREQQQAAMAELRRELSDYTRTISKADEAEVRALESVLSRPEAKASGGDMAAVQADLDLLTKQIAEFQKSGVIDDADLAVLKAADEQAARAEINARATEAAGMCQMVRG